MQHSVCVYCGSRPGHDEAFTRDAETLGRGLAEAGLRLVYGVGDVGKTDLTRYIVTETMHERKKVMFMNSDSVAVLPGGAGSLDELFEVLTWRQLGLHEKPIFLVNTNGYWDPFMSLMNHVVDHGFADRTLLDYVTVVADADAALSALRRAFSLRNVVTE